MNEKPWFKQYDEGVPQTIDYPEITLIQLFEDSAKKYPEFNLHDI